MKRPRIEAIDALRGLALAGVGLVHFLERFAGGLLGDGPADFLDHGWVDTLFRGVLWLSFGKFFALFSVLFGVSFALMRRSAAERGMAFGGRYLWRTVLLAGIGLVHQCFYRGDILIMYATLGPLLLLFDRLPTRYLVATALIFLIGLPRLLSFAVWGEGPVVGNVPVLDAAHPYAAAYTQLLREGSFAELARVHLGSAMALKFDLYLGILGRYYYTFAYFLIGLALGRSRVFTRGGLRPSRQRSLMRWSLGLLAVSGVLMMVLFSRVSQPIDWSQWLSVLALNFYDWTNVAGAALILLGFLACYRTAAGARVLALFAPYGRMALTNYVLLSVIGTFLLFDYGLGLFTVLRIHQLALLAVVVIVGQMAFSAYWLSHFRYGPLEWVWRSLTYLDSLTPSLSCPWKPPNSSNASAASRSRPRA